MYGLAGILIITLELLFIAWMDKGNFKKAGPRERLSLDLVILFGGFVFGVLTARDFL